MRNSSFDRPSSVKIDEDDRTIAIQGERIGHETDAVITETLAKQSHKHHWIQRGNYLHCDGANEFAHGVAIGVHDRYVGDDDNGNPIFQKLDVDKLIKVGKDKDKRRPA